MQTGRNYSCDLYCQLHLPVNGHAQNMFLCKTLKFSHRNVKFYFLTLLKGKMFSINKKGRNYQEGVLLSSYLRNQVKELAQDYSFSEIGQRLRISKGAVSKIIKQYNLTGSMAPKRLNDVRTVLKCTLQDSILLETICKHVVHPLTIHASKEKRFNGKFRIFSLESKYLET